MKARIEIYRTFSGYIEVYPFADGVAIRGTNYQAFVPDDDPNRDANIDSEITAAIDSEKLRFNNAKQIIIDDFTNQKPQFEANVEQIKNNS